MNTRALLAAVSVFIGCCSNVVFLELAIKDDPGCGNLLTFLQFLFISICGFVTVGEFGTAKLHIPLIKYLTLVVFFWSSSVANNYALNLSISMPLNMIFRAGSLMANMVMGVWILKRSYTKSKYYAVLMISVGICICTVVSSGDVKARGDVYQDSKLEADDAFIDWLWWCFGICIMTSTLFISARMGIFQESLYQKYGKRPWEALYMTHLLPLPLWLPLYSDIINHANIAFNSELLEVFGLFLPRQCIWFLLNVITQGFCISSVYILTTECTSLTVTMTVTLRKFISLIFSIIYFRYPFTLSHWVGTSLVFVGTLIFTELLQLSIGNVINITEVICQKRIDVKLRKSLREFNGNTLSRYKAVKKHT